VWTSASEESSSLLVRKMSALDKPPPLWLWTSFMDTGQPLRTFSQVKLTKVLYLFNCASSFSPLNSSAEFLRAPISWKGSGITTARQRFDYSLEKFQTRQNHPTLCRETNVGCDWMKFMFPLDSTLRKIKEVETKRHFTTFRWSPCYIKHWLYISKLILRPTKQNHVPNYKRLLLINSV